MSNKRLGFSLVELFVVIGVIGLLIGLILPAIQRTREAAARLSCLSNLRQIGIALHNYENDHHRFPPVMVVFPPVGAKKNGAAISWRAALLTYLEQGALGDATLEACLCETRSFP